jgi:hypothetical protein
VRFLRVLALLLLGFAASAAPAAAQSTRVVVSDVSTLQTATSSPGQYLSITCYHPSATNVPCAGGGDFDRATSCGTDTDNGATILQDSVATKNCYYRKNWGLNGVIDARQCGVYADGSHDDTSVLNACMSLAAANSASSRPGYSVVSTGGGQLLALSSIIIPQGVTLTCGARAAFGQIVNNDYTGVQSAIWLREDSGGFSSQTISTNSSPTRSTTGFAGIDGCVILRATTTASSPYDYSPTKFFPQSLRDSLNEMSHFLGTAITADGDGFAVTNTTILGFSQCWMSDGNVARIVLNHVNCDGTSGFLVNGGGGGTKFDDLNVRALLTGVAGCASCNEYVWSNSGNPSTDNLYGLVNSGVGIPPAYALILDTTNSKGNTTTNKFLPVFNDTIWVGATAGHFESAAGRYKIGSAPVDGACPTGTHQCRTIILAGSTYSDSLNKRPGTATWSTGVNVLTGSSIDVTTLAVGMHVGTTTGCFATGATIADINPNWNTIWITGSTAPSCSGTAANVQFWDDVPSGAYPTSATTTLTATERTGDGYATTGSAGVTFSNCQSSNHYVGFHVGDTSNFTRFVNCSNDNDGDLEDDGLIGLLCDGQHENNDCSQTEWVNGVLGQHAAGAIVLNTDSTHAVHVANAGIGPSGGRQTGRLADVNGGTLTLANATSELPGNLFVANGSTFVSLARQSGGSTYGSGYTAGDVVTMLGGTCSVIPQITIDTVDGSGVPLTWHQSKQGVCLPWPLNGWSTSGGTGTGTKGNSEAVAAKISMSNVVAPQGNLYLQGATAIASTNGCGNVFAKPTSYLCAPASVVSPPGGRLTLTSGQPVMNADVTAATSVYYVPYTGQQVPIYNSQAGVFSLVDMGSAGLTLSLGTSQQPANSLYDIFAETIGGSIELCAGPAWTNSGAGSSSRAVGISQVSGIWMNSAEMTACYNSPSVVRDCPALQCTYLGTMYATAAGQTSQQFGPNSTAGGTANCLCLYNAYNQVEVTSQTLDANPAYTYSGGWHAMDTGAPPPPVYPNRVNAVDGLGQMTISAKLADALTDTGQVPAIGINLNSISATPGLIASSSLTNQGTFDVILVHPPVLGRWFVQAMESTSGSGANATFGGPGFQQISVQVKD